MYSSKQEFNNVTDAENWALYIAQIEAEAKGSQGSDYFSVCTIIGERKEEKKFRIFGHPHAALKEGFDVYAQALMHGAYIG